MFAQEQLSGEYDAVVVGGGPAGAAAALDLGRQGVRTALFEKEPLPRYKPCGGGLTRRALSVLPFDSASALNHTCREVTICMGSDRSCTLRDRDPILGMVLRDHFDLELLKACRREGVHVLSSCAVREIRKEPGRIRLVTTRGDVRCRFAVAADGAVGKMARLAGWRETRRLVPALEVEVPFDEGASSAERALFDFSAVRHGYAWVFPKKGCLSIGVGVFTRKGPHRLSHALDAFLEAQGLNNGRVFKRKGAVIPVSPRKDGFVRNRVFLTGDAAGLADPLTGEGIFAALKSGRLAAEALVSCNFDENKSRECYETALQASFLEDLRLGRIVASLAYDFPRTRNGLFALYGRRLTEIVADIIAGKETYRTILQNPRRYLGFFRAKNLAPLNIKH